MATPQRDNRISSPTVEDTIQPEHARRWLLIAGACTLIFAVILMLVESGRVAGIDRSVERALHATFGGRAFDFFETISVLGGTVVRTVSVAILTLFLIYKRHWRCAALLVVAVAGIAALTTLVKVVVARPRPHLFTDALHASGYSFPSGHASNSIVFCGVLTFLVWHLTRRKGPTVIVATLGAIFTILIGIARVVVGVHYPSDVLGGYALGAAWLSLVLALFSYPLFRSGAARSLGRGGEKRVETSNARNAIGAQRQSDPTRIGVKRNNG